MRVLSLLFSFAATVALSSASAINIKALSVDGSANVPRSSDLSNCDDNSKDNWGNAIEQDRTPTIIRASKDDQDDVSDDFLAGITKANNGGLLVLEKGNKYIIGKKLDLTFLNDVYVRIDGELKVRSPKGSDNIYTDKS